MIKPILTACLLASLAGGAAAQTLDRIKQNGEIRLGFRADAPPLSYIDTEGRPSGYTLSLIHI